MMTKNEMDGNTLTERKEFVLKRFVRFYIRARKSLTFQSCPDGSVVTAQLLAQVSHNKL